MDVFVLIFGISPFMVFEFGINVLVFRILNKNGKIRVKDACGHSSFYLGEKSFGVLMS